MVFAGFLAAGGIALWSAEQASRPPARAVPGSPSAPAPQAGAAPSELPPDHPMIELPEEAVAFLKELATSAEAAPDSLEAWQKLARARYRAALVDPSYADDAEAALKHVLELDPDNLEAVRTRGNLAYDTRDYKGAETYFQRYLELDPGDPSVKTDLASALLFQGERDRAKSVYREVIARNPDFVQAHLNLGIALHADGDREGSKAELRAALDRAKSPEEKAQVERVIAMAQQRAGGPASQESQPGATVTAKTNAAGPFQLGAEKLLRGHPIVGPKIESVEWRGPSTAVVMLRSFPMQAMPPVMRNRFKSRINESLAKLATENGVDAVIDIELADAASKERMDSLDGKEWVGAFDEDQAQ
jgi:tetratricopeptide (TPR) repeat protein